MVAIEGFLTVLYGFYNTLFQPLLSLGPHIALGTFSAALAAIFSLIYYVFLDVEAMDEIKEKISKKQEKRKKAQKNENMDKASEHMKEAMSLNQEMMMLNFKPMIVTMVFVGLIFPWLGATFAPVIEMEQVNNTTFEGELDYGGNTQAITVINNSEPEIQVGEDTASVGEDINMFGTQWDVIRFGERSGGFFSSGEGVILKLNAKFVELPFSIPLAGTALNWLGFYILITMPLTFIFRKMLGIS